MIVLMGTRIALSRELCSMVPCSEGKLQDRMNDSMLLSMDRVFSDRQTWWAADLRNQNTLHLAVYMWDLVSHVGKVDRYCVLDAKHVHVHPQLHQDEYWIANMVKTVVGFTNLQDYLPCISRCTC